MTHSAAMQTHRAGGSRREATGTKNARLPLLLFLSAALLGALPSEAKPRKCGIERWDVKVARDAMAQRIDPSRLETTISFLAALMSPAPPVKATDRRGVGPEEFRVFVVEGTVIVAKPEPDFDVHIAIADVGAPFLTRGQTEPLSLIVEVAHPNCSEGSFGLEPIKTAREQLVAMIGGEPTRARLKGLLGRRLKVTGVGFYDKIHGQSGRAPNGIELHPVLALEEVRAVP